MDPASNPAADLHQMASPNEPIVLYEGSARLPLDEGELIGHARAEARWEPRPHTLIEIMVEQGDWQAAQSLSDSDRTARLLLPDRSLALDVHAGGFAIGKAGLRLRLRPAGDTISITASPLEASRIVFSLLNFEPFFVPDIERKHATTDTTVESGNWLLRIEPFPNAHEIYRELKSVGGFAATHACSLVRKDGRKITPSECHTVLHGLMHFFSFAQGAWAPPLFAQAMDGNRMLWQEWYFRMVGRWEEGAFSWFDRSEGQVLAETFLGYMDRWESKIWYPTFRAAIYWYIQSNDRGSGIDGALILAQTGLELLAWAYVVEEKGLATAEAFSKLTAADQIRLFLVSLEIPIGLDARTPTALKYARSENWQDAPQVITTVRNALVHGNPKHRRKLLEQTAEKPGILFETWNLALYLYELAILRLSGHNGVHAPRIDLPLMFGKVHPVPWAVKADVGHGDEGDNGGTIGDQAGSRIT